MTQMNSAQTEEEKYNARELYKPSLKLTPQVGHGVWGRVFRVSNFHVAKVCKSHIGSLETKVDWLTHQNDIAQKAYAKGISVPEPVGVFNVELRLAKNKDQKIVPGFIMEYINGRLLSDIDKKELKKVKDLWYSEKEKALQSGFIIFDAYEHNAIWCPERERVYLIDFEGWSYK